MRPEELILLLKARWSAHAELRLLPRREAKMALDRVISACIEEYYRGH
jgi:hypothetical protein